MEENTEPSEKYKASDRVESFLSTKHPITRERISELEQRDIRELSQIALGEAPRVSRGDRSKALFAVSRLDGTQSNEILNAVLANSKEDAGLRTIAAANLGLLSAEYAEPKLIANLKIKDDSIRDEVIKSLGLIGDINALKALDEISSIEQPDFVRRQLKFSKALISYRLGINRDDLSFVGSDRRTLERENDLIKLQIEQAKPVEVRESLKLLEGSTYGIDLSEELGFGVSAGKARWFLFLNKKFDEGNISYSMKKQKMIAGLVALRSEETGTYSVQYVVLTRPQGDIIDIMVIRTDGRISYSGNGRSEGDRMVFSISDAEQIGTAPTWIEGRLSPEGLEINKALISSKRREKHTTTNLTYPIN